MNCTGPNPIDSMARRAALPTSSSRGRVLNPIPFEGGVARLYGNEGSLANARENPVVTDDEWKRNIRKQARDIVRGTRSTADLIYLPPPNTDAFQAESVEEFWAYIRSKLDNDLPAHANIEDWSVVNSTIPGSSKSKAYNGRIKYWHKWHGAYIPEMEEDVSTEGKVKLKMVGHDRRANNLIDGFENPNVQEAGQTKARTQYFLLNLEINNLPGMQSYGELLKAGYYEIVTNENLRGRYVCNCTYIDDPIVQLGRNFAAALEKNLKKAAACIVSRNPSKVFDFTRSIQMAVGHGAPETKLCYDLVGKTFYVPGSAYDIRRKIENVATPERLEDQFRKVGELNEEGERVSSTSLGSVESTSLYSEMSNSPVVKSLAALGANELPDNQMDLGDAEMMLGTSADTNRSSAVRAKNSVKGRIPDVPSTYKGKSLPKESRYHLRTRNGKRITQGGPIPRRLRFDEEDAPDAQDDPNTNMVENEEVPFAVLENEDAYHFMFEHFREMFYHIMLSRMDMNNICNAKYLSVCDKIVLNNIFVLQVAYEYKLCFRIIMIPM